MPDTALGGTTTPTPVAAAAATPAPAATPQADPTEQKSWREVLPADIRDHSAIKGYTSLENMAKSHIHAQALIGKKGVIKPSDNASKEEWDAFYTSLGRPTKEKYELKVPDGKKVHPDMVETFKSLTFDAGLTPKQAQGILDGYLAAEEATVQKYQQDAAEETKRGIEALKTEWGAGYEKSVLLARQGVAKVGGDALRDHLVKTGFADDPVFIKAFAEMGKIFGEDSLREGGAIVANTPAEVEGRIQAVLADKNHPYYKPSDPGYARAQKEMNELFQQKALTRK
jgi:hypothetical protein